MKKSTHCGARASFSLKQTFYYLQQLVYWISTAPSRLVAGARFFKLIEKLFFGLLWRLGAR
jgi:hypothetical protein